MKVAYIFELRRFLSATLNNRQRSVNVSNKKFDEYIVLSNE